MLGGEKYKLLLLGFKPRMLQTVAWSRYWLRHPDFRKSCTKNSNKTGNVHINVIVWRVLPWKSNNKFVYWIWVSSLSYPACNFLAPCYIVSRSQSGSKNFYISDKQHNFREKIIEYKMGILSFSTTVVWDFFHSKENWTIYYHKLFTPLYNVLYFCWILRNFEKFQQMKENLTYQISWKSFIWESSYFMRSDRKMERRTDRQTWRSCRRFSKCCRRT